jgi:predicted dehydrogenase
MVRKVSEVAVVGGGRWGLIICSVLERILDSDVTIWLATQHLAAARVPARARRVSDVFELPHPGKTGAAIVATAPHEHAKTAQTLLSLGWNVLVEKPAALYLDDARAISDQAVKSGLLAWVGAVYFFARYLTVMRPHVRSDSRWVLEWCEPSGETRWGEVKLTPHHVSPVEDIFPHAWSILRSAGLTVPLRVEKIDLGAAWSPRIQLVGADVSVELMINRYARSRRRYLRLETKDESCELDFSEEPGTFKINGAVQAELPWNPSRRPLAAELLAFLAACAGDGLPGVPITIRENLEAVALMEDATKALLCVQARRVAEASHTTEITNMIEDIIRDALFRELAISGVRLERNSPDELALLAASQATIRGKPNALTGLSASVGEIVRRSPFLAQVREARSALRR